MTEPQPERITRAAIRYKGNIVSLPQPARHHDIIRHIADELKWHPHYLPVCGPEDQGFVTNTGRFIDRVEAYRVALNAGQLLRGTPNLFSEDVW